MIEQRPKTIERRQGQPRAVQTGQQAGAGGSPDLFEAAQILYALVGEFERIEEDLHDGQSQISVLGKDIKRALEFMRRLDMAGESAVTVQPKETVIAQIELDVVHLGNAQIVLKYGDATVGRILSDEKLRAFLEANSQQ